MFNKKATVIHWILFGIVAIAGIYLVMRIDLSSQLGVKGAWQVSFVHATQESEKDLLLLDQTAREVVEQSLQEFSGEVFQNDLGCGVYQEAVLWNNKSGFCSLKLDEKVAEKIKKLMFEKTNVNYTKIIITEGDVVGVPEMKKSIVSLTEHIPTETRSAGLFETYEAYLIKPYYLKYDYKPSFRVKAKTGRLSELEQEARELVLKCQTESKLKDCLDLNRKSDWKYSRCENDDYRGEGRFVVFCVAKGTQQYKFVLDFIPLELFKVEEVGINYKETENVYEISFPRDDVAESYNLYYTNWPSVQGKQGMVEDIFSSMPTTQLSGYFYRSVAVAQPGGDNCPEEKNVGEVYLCSNKVVYVLKSDELLLGVRYYFAATAIKQSQESTISSFS